MVAVIQGNNGVRVPLTARENYTAPLALGRLQTTDPGTDEFDSALVEGRLIQRLDPGEFSLSSVRRQVTQAREVRRVWDVKRKRRIEQFVRPNGVGIEPIGKRKFARESAQLLERVSVLRIIRNRRFAINNEVSKRCPKRRPLPSNGEIIFVVKLVRIRRHDS